MVTAENEMKIDATEPQPEPVQLHQRRSHPQLRGGERLADPRPHAGVAQPASALDAEPERQRAAQRHDQSHQRRARPLPGQDGLLGRGQRGVRRRQRRAARPRTCSAPATTGSRSRSAPRGRPIRRRSLLQRLQHRGLERGQDPGRVPHGPGLPVARRPARLRRVPGPLRRNGMPANFQTTLANFAAAGVDVAITELDIAQAGATPYAQVPRPASTCRAAWASRVGACANPDSWRASELPLGVRRQRQQEGVVHLGAERAERRVHRPPSP